MTITIKGHIIAVGCVLLASALCSNLHADENTKESPPIKAAWIPGLKLDYVTLSLTNQGNSPIEVAGQLEVDSEGEYLFRQRQKKIQLQEEGSNADTADETIRATLILTDLKAPDTSIIYKMGGVEAQSIEIAPGEKKVIKFLVHTDYMKLNPSQATLLLTWKNKELNRVAMAKVDNVWEEEKN